jgi:glycosyltransferase involved in cell wall biosynthesis
MLTNSSIFAGKRVLHLIGDSAFGGDTLYLFALAVRMREYGGEVYVGTTAPETVCMAQQKGFAVIELPALKREINPRDDLRALRQVFRACRKNRFDLVHTHTSKPGIVGRIAARLAGVPCVVHTIHGFSFHERSSWLEWLAYTNLERIAGLFCDLAISVNQEDRATALKQWILKREKVVTVPNGVDTKRFQTPFDRKAVREALGVAEDEVLVGCVGRMAEQKDPRTFLEAAKLLIRVRPNVRCIFVGDGPLFEEMKSFADGLNLGDRLLLPGFRRDVENILRALDVFVLNSLWEGMPFALLEAMCVGLPIVVTNIKGNRECADESCSLLVRPKSPDEIKDGVLRLVDNSELAAGLGQRARQRFEENFAEERMLEKTFALYEKVLSRKLGGNLPVQKTSSIVTEAGVNG